MTLKLATVIPVWVLTVVVAVIVIAAAWSDGTVGGLLDLESDFAAWLGLAFAGAVILSFCVQLAVQRTEGFLSRVVASIVGSLVVLVIATVILTIAH